MPIDAPVIAGLVQELKKILPVKVDKIFQPFPDEIIFYCFGSGVTYKLLISLNSQFARINLLEGTHENPSQSPAFCMLLRKHFSGSKIIAIDVVPFERICRLTFEVYDPMIGLTKKHIWLELMGKNSNLILTNQDGLVLDTWRKSGFTITGRDLSAGNKYELPSTGGRWQPVTLNWDQFLGLITHLPPDATLEKFLLKHWFGLSSLTIHEITGSIDLNPQTLCREISETTLPILYDVFKRWANMVTTESYQPSCLYDTQGIARDCSAFPILNPPNNLLVRNTANLNQTVAEITERNQLEIRFTTYQNNLLHRIQTLISKAQTKLSKQQTEAATAEQSDSFRISGELLTTYGTQIKKGQSEARLNNHYDPHYAELVININPALTAQENAQVYFKKYQKAKKGQIAIRIQIQKTQETIQYLESIETLIQSAQNLTDLKLVQNELESETTETKHRQKRRPDKPKKEPEAEPRRFITPEGDIILVGRNNLQNDRLTFKIASPEDLWFHTQKMPGSHVILKINSGSLTDQSLNCACQLAVFFSKGRQSTKIPVDYTARKNVKKPPASKPGFVIYDFFKTAIITPDLELLRQLGVKVD